MKICFFPLFSRTSSISFSKQPSKNDAIVHGIFFFSLINFYLSSLFRPIFFYRQKDKRAGVVVTPVGSIKEFFLFFYYKFYLQRNQIVCTKRITVSLITILWNRNFESRKFFQLYFIPFSNSTNSYLLPFHLALNSSIRLFFYHTEKFDSSKEKKKSTEYTEIMLVIMKDVPHVLSYKRA